MYTTTTTTTTTTTNNNNNMLSCGQSAHFGALCPPQVT